MLHGRAGGAETDVPPDEYQDGTSAGSLAKARCSWLDLMATDVVHLPQQFTFVFHCPSRHMALGLTDFLRYADYAGWVRATDPVAIPDRGPWQVAGTSRATVWSLAGIEHLFMHLRQAGSRYESTLMSLHLLPMSGGLL